MAKIESLHGTTPAEILQSGFDNLSEIEAIVASVLWKDGTVTAGGSNADIATITHMIVTLDEEHRKRHFR